VPLEKIPLRRRSAIKVIIPVDTHRNSWHTQARFNTTYSRVDESCLTECRTSLPIGKSTTEVYRDSKPTLTYVEVIPIRALELLIFCFSIVANSYPRSHAWLLLHFLFFFIYKKCAKNVQKISNPGIELAPPWLSAMVVFNFTPTTLRGGIIA
jgi:hypothetical protein